MIPHGNERHLSGRAGWLRAAVLGADDGLVSTASLMVGVAAATSTGAPVIIAGLAGMAAGALSMAAGEFVSVSSQRDSELADLEKEKRELADRPLEEERELAGIYEQRGLSRALAEQVARALSKGDRLANHARDELGLNLDALARPWQASLVSGLSFSFGALTPILVVLLAKPPVRIALTVGSTLVALATLGAVGAQLGGASRLKGALRVLIGGGIAMGMTALIGHFAALVV